MPTPVITETDMTTPKNKVVLEYDSYIVELNYDNNLLTNATITPTVADTDPGYIPPFRLNGSLGNRTIIDAVYDYRSKV